jgi:hypothetical protein
VLELEAKSVAFQSQAFFPVEIGIVVASYGEALGGEFIEFVECFGTADVA